MQPITLTATVDEQHRLVIDLPDNVPAGRVEVTIRLLANDDSDLSEPRELTRDEARAKLIAAGLVSPSEAEPDALEVSDDELKRLAQVFASERPLSELIDEDRAERL